MSSYTTRPLSDRNWLNPSARVPTRFSAKWDATLEVLYREVEMLDGRGLVIEVDITEGDLRLDGTIRARARAASPAVIVSFDSKHGPLSYRCDRFVAAYYNQPDDWQQNVRAIALTLEALRSVDRYGATETGQQYAGWKAIGSAPAQVRQGALEVLAELAGITLAEAAADTGRAASLARRKSHPDTGGSTEKWHRYSAAVTTAVRAKSGAVR